MSQANIRRAAIEVKTLEINLGGRDRPDFGTVRPRVQIPGPRLFPTSVYLMNSLLRSAASILVTTRAGGLVTRTQSGR